MFVCNIAAQKDITVEDIYANSSFRTRSVSGFNFLENGVHFSRLESDHVEVYEIASGQKVVTLFNPGFVESKGGWNGHVDHYSYHETGGKILVESESEPLYRHSTKVKCHIFDINNREWTSLYDGKVSHPQWSPDGQKIAFVFNNNLYYRDLENNKVVQVTSDGMTNKIINGMCDWVYEEEFGFTRAFYWSPDSKKLAFLRFDESMVPEFTMQIYSDDMYPKHETFKYPKVGENNSDVTAWVFSLENQQLEEIKPGSYEYIPRMMWTQEENTLCIFTMNRHQNHLTLHLYNTQEKQLSTLLEEKNPYYIDITDNLTFLKNKKHFVWSSEKEGFHQLYLYRMDGTLETKLTKGRYDVHQFYGVDEKNKVAYFQASTETPIDRCVYRVGLDGNELTKITSENRGTCSARFNNSFDYFILTYSTADSPPVYSVHNKKGQVLRVIEDNASYMKKAEEYAFSPVEFFAFQTSEKIRLHGFMIKPRGFNPNRSYPVFMTQYSGPGSQQVTDAWKGASYLWYQLLSQKGYLVVCVDGRGTGGRGEEFKKMTYLNLGHYETIDQIETAKYLGSLPYVDKSRIGIYGWSYGGYMSSLCILKGADVFKAAIAVAPVTNWKWYDSIYTERYMRTLSENKEGYEKNSPVYFADKLKGSYLLIHGMADDNVHFQHAVEMADALIKANKQFDTYYYPNRNHGIYGGNTRWHLFTKMTDFILKNI